jgi:hypothetical protein
LRYAAAVSTCTLCGEIGARVVADLAAGEALPTAAGKLDAIAQSSARRCPACGAWFLYTYDYEYGAIGDGWETASLERVERDRVVDKLLTLPPSDAVGDALAQLGVPDGLAAITSKLVAQLDDPAASYDAVRKLVSAYLETSDTAAIERLLAHSSAKVQADARYMIDAHRGSLVFQAAAAATDPSPEVRAAAARAAFPDRSPSTTSEDPSPPIAPPARPLIESAVMGCERCTSPDAPAAWRAMTARRRSVLASGDHFSIDKATCSCGQDFIVILTERGDHRQREDERTWLALPITRGELTQVRHASARYLPEVITKLGAERRFLVRVKAGSSTNAWWRDGGFSIDPALVRAASAQLDEASAKHGSPTSWLLDAGEVAAFWAFGVPLETWCVPDVELRQALVDHRVKQAVCESSMGTAETYWRVAPADAPLAEARRDGVVMPPASMAVDTPRDQWEDDRDVDRVLWQPFHAEQRAALVRALPRSEYPGVLAQYAEILAVLEERWAEGPKLDARAPFLVWLRAGGPVDVDELDRWLVAYGKRSVRHLVRGIRARWISQDIETAFQAVMESASRFEDPDTERTTHLELLRCALHAAREFAGRAIA